MALQPIVKRLSRDAVAVAEILVVRERERERLIESSSPPSHAGGMA